MRIPEYLSPTSINLYYQDEEEFYYRYLSEHKKPREPQTQPMAVGSAFDAFCKSYLHNALFGKTDERFELKTIFEEQVAGHNRDWAWEEGRYVFGLYKAAGCLADLILELNQAVGKPRFEFSIQDVIESDIGGIPLLGKPDVFFINSEGARVVYDWKVNGYCADRVTSPMRGYIKLREMEYGEGRLGWKTKKYRYCEPVDFKGIMINEAMHLEDGNASWADQLCIYSWLLGEEVGSEEVIFGIDQVVGPKGNLRFATHRLKINPNWHYILLGKITILWNAILNNHIFRELPIEESRRRCELLDEIVTTETLEGEEKERFDAICS